MSKLKLIGLALPLFLLFASPYASAPKAFGAAKKTLQGQGQTGTLQRMIVENGSVTMDLDLNRLNGISLALARPATLQFTVAANSFFTILVFNDLLRGPDSGSMALIPQASPAAGVNAPGYSLPLSFSGSENFLPTRDLILRSGTARAGSSFSMSKGTSTTMTQTRSCSASPMDACWFRRNSRSPLAARRTPGQLLAKSPSVQPWKRSRSTISTKTVT